VTRGGGCLLVAHRGAPVGGTGENTIRAFREAAAAGADGVELDVRGTKDGRVAVLHDETVVRDGKRVAVRDLALEELRDPTVEALDRVVPLEEAIRALLARTGVVVEIKEPGLEDRVCQVLASLKADQRLPWLLVASFHPSVVKGVARAAPGFRRALVVSPRGPGLLGSLRGRMPLRAFRSSGAQDLMPSHETVDAALVEGVGKAKGRVIPWTVNDARRAAALAAMGCGGVITDDLAAVGPAVRGGGDVRN
jgi:glycerophosphoryl diester phosphodiesterase